MEEFAVDPLKRDRFAGLFGGHLEIEVSLHLECEAVQDVSYSVNLDANVGISDSRDPERPVIIERSAVEDHQLELERPGGAGGRYGRRLWNLWLCWS